MFIPPEDLMVGEYLLIRGDSLYSRGAQTGGELRAVTANLWNLHTGCLELSQTDPVFSFLLFKFDYRKLFKFYFNLCDYLMSHV